MPGPRLPPRLKLLRAVDARPHRYHRLRRLSTALSLLVLFAIPGARLARFDAWGGAHYALGRRVDALTGLGAVFIAILSFYLVTFVLNAGFGRIFCGWGCPVAQLCRLGETGRRGGRARLEMALQDAAFATAVLSWWVSPRVVVDGSPRAIAVVAGAWVILMVAMQAHALYWRWGFCRHVCPIGLYYSVVQTGHGFGVHFDRALGSCIDCMKCVEICPVSLDPRDLDRPVDGIGGLAIDGMPGTHHCLTCGDCVRACELVLKQVPRERIPLRLGRRIKGDSGGLPRGAGERR